MAKTEKELMDLRERILELNRELEDLNEEELDWVTGGRIMARAGKTTKVVVRGTAPDKENI